MQAYYPSRLMSTGYNMMYMVLIFALFKWGAGRWPSKHSRMLTGYLLYVAALATPPAVSGLNGCAVLSPSGWLGTSVCMLLLQRVLLGSRSRLQHTDLPCMTQCQPQSLCAER
jgi:hypothetical protein